RIHAFPCSRVIVVETAHIDVVPVLGRARQHRRRCGSRLVELLQHIQQPGHRHRRPPVVVCVSVCLVKQRLVISISHQRPARQCCLQCFQICRVCFLNVRPLRARNRPIRHIRIHGRFLFHLGRLCCCGDRKRTESRQNNPHFPVHAFSSSEDS